MLKIKFISILVFAVTLTACGGGGSSSGGQAAPTPVVSNDGTYNGTWNATFSSPGVPSVMDTVALVITINGSNITISDGDFTATGIIDDNNGFNAAQNGFAAEIDGVSCNGNITFAGSVNNGTVSGNSRARLLCSARGVRPFTITTTGPYNATRANSKIAAGGTMFDIVRRVISN